MISLPEIDNTVSLLYRIIHENNVDLIREKKRFKAFLADYTKSSREVGQNYQAPHRQALFFALDYPKFDDVFYRYLGQSGSSMSLSGLSRWMARNHGFSFELCAWSETVWCRLFGLSEPLLQNPSSITLVAKAACAGQIQPQKSANLAGATTLVATPAQSKPQASAVSQGQPQVSATTLKAPRGFGKDHFALTALVVVGVILVGYVNYDNMRKSHVKSPSAAVLEQRTDARSSDKPMLPVNLIRDCSACPAVVLIPFATLNSSSTSTSATGSMQPNTEFYMGKYEVKVGEWMACVKDGGCPEPDVKPDQIRDSKLPITGVSWFDTQSYTKWLSQKTGHTYRLPTDKEWEYAARAGVDNLKFTWGNTLRMDLANCSDCLSNDKVTKLLPVGSFPPNKLDLFDIHGNVWEWVQDCYNENTITFNDRIPCDKHLIRGGSFKNPASAAQLSRREPIPSNGKSDYVGFRIVRE